MKVVLNLKWQDLSKSEHNVVFPLIVRMTCVRILKHKKVFMEHGKRAEQRRQTMAESQLNY